MEKLVDNYPAMITLEKNIGKRLAEQQFKKNKYSYKFRRETYNTNYIRSSVDSKFVHVASLSISSPLSEQGDDLSLVPITISIEAGVEYRPAFLGALRPKESRDEMKLAACDCTFQMPDSFNDIAMRRIVITSGVDDLADCLEELLASFVSCTKLFFAQFVYPYPFDQLPLADVVALYETSLYQMPKFKFKEQFATSPYRLAEATEEYWKELGNEEQAELFKRLRRKIWNNPHPCSSALDVKPADEAQE